MLPNPNAEQIKKEQEERERAAEEHHRQSMSAVAGVVNVKGMDIMRKKEDE